MSAWRARLYGVCLVTSHLFPDWGPAQPLGWMVNCFSGVFRWGARALCRPWFSWDFRRVAVFLSFPLKMWGGGNVFTLPTVLGEMWRPPRITGFVLWRGMVLGFQNPRMDPDALQWDEACADVLETAGCVSLQLPSHFVSAPAQRFVLAF